MKTIKILCICAAIMMGMTACTYPFDPEIEQLSQECYVVEGDICIGSYSMFAVTKTVGLNGNSHYPIQNASFKIQDEDGKIYDLGSSKKSSGFDWVHADTRKLNPNKKYRLIIGVEGGTIESDWLTPLHSGEVEKVEYTIDPTSKAVAWFDVTSKVQDGQKYYRWVCKEHWEYHTMYEANYKVVPRPEWGSDWYKVVPRPEEENLFWCWDFGRRGELFLATSDEAKGGRFVNHRLFSVSNTDPKTIDVFGAEVIQMAISKEAYDYWRTIQVNSGDVGGLFSPQPAILEGGNLHFVGKDEPVIGYICAAVVSSKMGHLVNKMENFYKGKREYVTKEMVEIEAHSTIGIRSTTSAEFRLSWSSSYPSLIKACLPVSVYNESWGELVAAWRTKECTDCTIWGGTKNKPEGWPSDNI